MWRQISSEVNVVLTATDGEEATGLEAKEMTEGTANVDMETKNVKKVTGAKFDKLGG